MMNLQKNTLHQFTLRYCPNPTRSHINCPNRTLQYYITSQPVCPHCSMQHYRLPYDNLHTRPKDSNSSYTLVFRNNAQIWFPKILHSDNGAEFKPKLIEHITQHLSVKKTYISPCHSQANGKLESSHWFIKDCIWNFLIGGTVWWDQLFPYMTAAFNWFPNEDSQEFPHFLYFGCNLYLPHLAITCSQNQGR